MITVFVFSSDSKGNRKVGVEKPKFKPLPVNKVLAKTIKAQQVKKPSIEQNPVVRFYYPSSKNAWKVPSLRTVRLISADHRYFVGLEISDSNRFKKFLRSKASCFSLDSYATDSMS